MFWQARAITEFNRAPITLFGTLTTSPDNDALFDARSRIDLAKQGVDFDRLPPVEIFRERVRTAGKELTKFLKRLREGDSVRGKPAIRYLLIAEAHNGAKTSDAKRGRPHWHVLLHEQNEDARLVLPSEWARWPNGEPRSDKYGQPYPAETSFLKRQWNIGHCTFSMARNAQAAGYLCKYLTKEDAHTRVRASFRYGHTSESEGSATEVSLPAKPGTLETSTPPKGKDFGITGTTVCKQTES